jgi:transcriptional regulator with XRE-family HTH domain
MTVNAFWDRVYNLMKKNKITQKEAAASCGVSLRTFQNWKYRNLYPTIVDGYLLARFLGVSMEYLVSGKEGDSKKKIEKVRSLLGEADRKLQKIL